MQLRSWLASIAAVSLLSVSSMSTTALAQVRMSEADPNWAEGEVPPPPAYSKDKLLPLDISKPGEIKYGFDPASMAVGKDFVTRYVMVAYSDTGGFNATYEGLRCATGEVKVYARQFSPNGAWSPIKEPQWQNVYATRYRYAKELALQGVCDGASNRRTVKEILEELKHPYNVNMK